jgi:hypothetical protein
MPDLAAIALADLDRATRMVHPGGEPHPSVEVLRSALAERDALRDTRAALYAVMGAKTLDELTHAIKRLVDAEMRAHEVAR